MITFSIQNQRRDPWKNANNLDFINITNYSPKDTVKRMRWQVTDWQRISAKAISDKGLLFKIRILKTQQEENEPPNLKIGQIPEQTFHQRWYTDGR